MSEKAALKSGFVNFLECFIPGTFARIIFVLPEKNSKISVTGGATAPLAPLARTPMYESTNRQTINCFYW